MRSPPDAALARAVLTVAWAVGWLRVLRRGHTPRWLPGDLQIHEGDVITVVAQDGEWWEGILNGQRGYFPATYAELL